MERVCCRRFNVPQANHHIIGQRVGTTRRNIGLCQKKTAAEFAQAFALSTGKLRVNKLKQPLTEPHTLTKCPMLTTPCPLFTLGTEIHGDSTEADRSSAWVWDKDQLGCRLLSGVHHAADVSLCLVRTRREGRRGARTKIQEASTSLSKSCLSRF